MRSLAEYCEAQPGLGNALALLGPIPEAEPSNGDMTPPRGADSIGYVYMVKSGRYYKIALTNDVGRRRYEFGVQLPEATTLMHVIATDDPAGIERYWHGRFAASRLNGEWFDLHRSDVAAFKKRKFM